MNDELMEWLLNNKPELAKMLRGERIDAARWWRERDALQKQVDDLSSYIVLLRSRFGCGDACVGCEWCMPPEAAIKESE